MSWTHRPALPSYGISELRQARYASHNSEALGFPEPKKTGQTLTSSRHVIHIHKLRGKAHALESYALGAYVRCSSMVGPVSNGSSKWLNGIWRMPKCMCLCVCARVCVCGLVLACACACMCARVCARAHVCVCVSDRRVSERVSQLVGE